MLLLEFKKKKFNISDNNIIRVETRQGIHTGMCIQ